MLRNCYEINNTCCYQAFIIYKTCVYGMLYNEQCRRNVINILSVCGIGFQHDYVQDMLTLKFPKHKCPLFI